MKLFSCPDIKSSGLTSRGADTCSKPVVTLTSTVPLCGSVKKDGIIRPMQVIIPLPHTNGRAITLAGVKGDLTCAIEVCVGTINPQKRKKRYPPGLEHGLGRY